MRKAKRNAIKLESRIQQLSAMKVDSDNAGVRAWAKRRLADGLGPRIINAQRIRCDKSDVATGIPIIRKVW
jgi:hypothetical protein